MYVRPKTRGRGFGDYEKSGDWRWEWYPPPYDFLAPGDSAPQPAPTLNARGFGCAAGGCGCGGKCGASAGSAGLGLFSSMDPSTWGWGEWIAIAAGGYFVISAWEDSKTAGTYVGRKGSRAYRSAKGAATSAPAITLTSAAVTAAAVYGAWYLWNQSQQAASGLSAYMKQSFLTPQDLLDPVNSAQVAIPAGW